MSLHRPSTVAPCPAISSERRAPAAPWSGRPSARMCSTALVAAASASAIASAPAAIAAVALVVVTLIVALITTRRRGGSGRGVVVALVVTLGRGGRGGRRGRCAGRRIVVVLVFRGLVVLVTGRRSG